MKRIFSIILMVGILAGILQIGVLANDVKKELVNVATGKPVTARSEATGWGAKENINDGNLDSFWFGSEGQGGDPEKIRWIQLDLLKRYNIEKIELFDRSDYVDNADYNNARLFLDILGSNDENFNTFTKIGEVGEADAFPKFGKFTLNIEPNNAYRYIRVAKQNIHYDYILAEINIFASQTLVEVATGKPAIASSSFDSFLPSKANNGTNIDGGDCWITFNEGASLGEYHHWQVDLGKEYPIGLIEIEDRVGNGDDSTRRAIIVYGSNTAGTPDPTIEIIGSEFTPLTGHITESYPAYPGFYQGNTISTLPMRYLTYRKTYPSNAMLGSFRAYVVSPVIATVKKAGAVVTVEFSDEMDLATLTSDKFTLKANDNTIVPQTNIEKTSYTYSFTIPSAYYADSYKLTVSDGILSSNNLELAYEAEYDISGVTMIIDFDFSGNTALEQNSTAGARVTIKNDSFEEKSILFVTALYEDGLLREVSADEEIIPSGGQASLSAEVETKTYTVSDLELKAFIWYSGALMPFDNINRSLTNNE